MSSVLRGILVLVVFVLAACGSSNVSISNPNYEPKVITPDKLLADLEKAPNDAVREQVLARLKGKLGERLEWSAFWSALAQRPIGKILAEKNGKTLFPFHAKACDHTSFHSFVRYVISVKSGFEHVVGKQRACLTPIPPDLVAKSYTVYKDSIPAAALTLEKDRELLSFVVNEMRKHPASSWAAVWDAGLEERIRSTMEKVLAAEGEMAVLALAYRIKDVTGTLAYADLLQPGFFTKKPLRDDYLTTHTRSELVTMLSQIAEAYPENVVNVPEADRLTLIEELFSDALEYKGTSHDEAWNHHVATKLLVQSLQDDQKIESQLATMERLQRRIEGWTRSNDAGAEAANQSRITRLSHPSLLLDAVWLAYRLGDKHPELKAAAVAKNVKTGARLGRADQVLQSRIFVHQATGISAKRAAKITFCQLMETLEIEETPLNATQFSDAMKDGSLKAGCYVVTSGNEIAIESESITMSSDAFVTVPNMSVAIKAQKADLSMFDLSTNLEYQPLGRTPGPKSSDAVLFPTIITLTVPVGTPLEAGMTEPLLERGTYFVVIHHVYNQAKPGEKDPQTPENGRDGGSLKLEVVAKVPPLSFFSEGGAGQGAAPRMDGGKGDVSEVKPETLVTWLEGHDADEELDYLPGDYALFTKPTPARIKALIERSTKVTVSPTVPAGTVRIFGYPDMPSVLPADQREKAKQVCDEVMGFEINESELGNVMRDQFARKFWNDAIAEFNKRDQNGTLAADAKFELLDPEKKLTMPGASPGPENAPGKRGNDGKVIPPQP